MADINKRVGAPPAPLTPSNGSLTDTGVLHTSSSSFSVTQINPKTLLGGNQGVPTPSTPSSSTILSTATAASKSTSHIIKSSSTSANDRLSNGAVAGVVIAVALGLALLTFVATFFTMHRNRGSQKAEQTPLYEKPDQMDADRKGPLLTARSRGSDSMMIHLPQSADDATLQRNVAGMLEQIGLHIENFYQNTPTSRTEVEESDLELIDSSSLPAPLAVMLPQCTKAHPLLKHTLSNLVMTSISFTGSPTQSILPAEFVFLPSKTRSPKSSTSRKPGKSIIVLMRN